MSEYPKIETLYERDESFKVKQGVLRNKAYGLIKTWQWTEKIDGTNIRCIWKPQILDAHAGGIERPESLEFRGRTDNAQIHGDLVKHLYETLTPDKMRAAFPETDVVLYGEGYGAGIQKVGVEYGKTKRFILFDVLVGQKWWLNTQQVRDVAKTLNIPVVPYFGEMTLEAATGRIQTGIPSGIGECWAEGLVGRPAESLFDKRGNRLIIKLKTKDFASGGMYSHSA